LPSNSLKVLLTGTDYIEQLTQNLNLMESRMRVIWAPGYYGGDQPLRVGQTGPFVLFKEPPVGLRALGEHFFYFHTDPTKANNVSGTITSITHTVLGEVREIINDGHTYRIILVDGTQLTVNAEENPGQVMEAVGPQSLKDFSKITEWYMLVEIE
jgi:hypothetical protein